MKALIYYHNDMDGKCCAAIVKKALDNRAELEFVPMMYDDSVELPKDMWNYWRVYILDFTLPKTQMDELCTLLPREDIIWIEHHISALEKYEDKYSHFNGIRRDGVAACELTWKWMHGDFSELPRAVKYISDRDLWKMDDENTMYFYEWLTTVPNHPDNSIWRDLWNGPLNKYISSGRLLRGVRIGQMKRDIKNVGYESEIDGKKCFKANYSSYESISDAGHYICDDLGYDIAWIHYTKKNNDGKLVKISNLRSTSEVDVSEIAMKYGGGGHMRASGFFEVL